MPIGYAGARKKGRECADRDRYGYFGLGRRAHVRPISRSPGAAFNCTGMRTRSNAIARPTVMAGVHLGLEVVCSSCDLLIHRSHLCKLSMDLTDSSIEIEDEQNLNHGQNVTVRYIGQP